MHSNCSPQKKFFFRVKMDETRECLNDQEVIVDRNEVKEGGRTRGRLFLVFLQNSNNKRGAYII